MTVTLELKCKVVNAVLQHMQINTYAILLYWERVFQKCSCFATNLIRIFVGLNISLVNNNIFQFEI